MTFLPDPANLPAAGDRDAAATGFTRWKEVADRADADGLGAFARELADDGKGHALLEAVFGNSPFLTQCVLQDPATLRNIVENGAEAAFDAALVSIKPERGRSQDETMAVLRRARRKVALTTALADIGGEWDVVRVTAALSRFADAAVGAALTALLWEAEGRGEIKLTNADDPAAEAGLFVLGVGKLGAHELNYSSDIDLIALYDDERLDYTGRQSPPQFYIRIVRDLVNMLEKRTRDGYVFRTDLRLRPDPASTPLAVSVRAAELYYESTGQNWERAALIKARVIAGDRQAGEDFLQMLEPFLWRKNLDFAAIEDIHSIKRQINAHRGGGSITVAGHNLKLGRGGIREIEFFCQTQQLIWGGRVPELRTPATCDTLQALRQEGRIDDDACRELTEAYHYLRRAEHRLQMVDDRQTHSLPDDDDALERIAVFLGYDGAEAFSKELTGYLTCVEHHYAHLFEESPSLSGPGNLVFTGGEDDPDTLETLRRMGFSDVSMIADRVRTWHRGRARATRSGRAREFLTEIVPALLDALSKTANPDTAFRNFDRFLMALPAGVQLLSLFQANPRLLALIAEIMGSSPKLGDQLAANPSLLDGVLTGDFYGDIEDKAALDAGLAEAMSLAHDFEGMLDMSRRFANDHKFKVGMQILKGQLDCDGAGVALSDLADVILARLFDVVRGEMENKHGRVGGAKGRKKGRDMCIVALGKLGGREITENSDLDLLFIYDDPGDGADADADEANVSDGERSLTAGQYFARLSQQLITAVSAPTAEGKLYEVDMRLRPSGNAGPIAVSLEAFRQYQAASAWSWEHMALTRARLVAGPEELQSKARDAIRDALTVKRDRDKLKGDVTDMRARLQRGHPASSMWDVKYVPGGLIDVEFIAQYLQLRHACEEPDLLDPNTAAALGKLAEAGHLQADSAESLIRAGRLWRTIQGMLRFTFDGGFNEEAAPAALKAALARAADAGDFDALKARMEETARETRAHFVAIVGDPDQAAAT